MAKAKVKPRIKPKRLSMYSLEIVVNCEVIAESLVEAIRLAEESVLSGRNGTDASVATTQLISEQPIR